MFSILNSFEAAKPNNGNLGIELAKFSTHHCLSREQSRFENSCPSALVTCIHVEVESKSPNNRIGKVVPDVARERAAAAPAAAGG